LLSATIANGGVVNDIIATVVLTPLVDHIAVSASIVSLAARIGRGHLAGAFSVVARIPAVHSIFHSAVGILATSNDHA
jgi:hypothetical protein